MRSGTAHTLIGFVFLGMDITFCNFAFKRFVIFRLDLLLPLV